MCVCVAGKDEGRRTKDEPASQPARSEKRESRDTLVGLAGQRRGRPPKKRPRGAAEKVHRLASLSLAPLAGVSLSPLCLSPRCPHHDQQCMEGRRTHACVRRLSACSPLSVQRVLLCARAVRHGGGREPPWAGGGRVCAERASVSRTVGKSVTRSRTLAFTWRYTTLLFNFAIKQPHPSHDRPTPRGGRQCRQPRPWPACAWATHMPLPRPHRAAC